MTRIGLISDTHGLLRPQALAALAGCERIVHAGDIGDPAILDELARIAPLSAVRGNNDRDSWAENLPEQLGFDVAGLRVHLLHEIAHLRLEASPQRMAGPRQQVGQVAVDESFAHRCLRASFAMRACALSMNFHIFEPL